MKILQVILTLLLVSLTSAFGETPTPPSIDSESEVAKSPEYRSAKAAEKSHDAAKMLSQAKTLVERFPGSALAHKAMSDAYYYMNFLDEAITSLDKALKISPDDTIGWRNLGQIRNQQEKWDEAEAAYKKAVNAAKDDPTPWTNLASFYTLRGNTKFALIAANSASALLGTGSYNEHHGEAPEAATRRDLGIVFTSCKIPEDGAKHLKRSIALQPEDPLSWCWLSVAYNQKGDRSNALAAVQQALKLNPDFELAKIGLQYFTANPSQNQQSPLTQTRPPTLEQQAQILDNAKRDQELRLLQLKQQQMQQQLGAQGTQEILGLIKQLEEMYNQPRRR